MEQSIKIFGFSGKIGVGKNYVGEQIFGKALHNLGYRIHILAVADQTKYELGSRLALIKENFIGEMDKIFDELFVNKSAETRIKLQYYGTEYCRNGGNWNIKDNFIMFNEPRIWIKGLYLQIKNILSKSYDISKDIFIISDVRFINEADFIKSLGGRIIRIISHTRNNIRLLEEAKKNYTIDSDIDNFIQRIQNHESETNLDNYNFDYSINNEPDNKNVESEINLIINTFFKF
jgi:hypothetical protein